MFNFTFDFGEIPDIYRCQIAVDTPMQDVRINTIEAPKEIIIGQFMSLVQEAANMQQPVRIELARNAPAYDAWNDKEFTVRHYIEFKNKAYVEFMQETDN